MAQGTSQHPLQVLQEIEARCRKFAAGLPQQEEVREEWLGIAFRVGELHLAAPLGEVVELLTFPSMTRVPGAKSWVLGVANVRGNLLPVMDLSGFLYDRATVLTKRSRVLVLKQGGVFAGLLVDEVIGQRHFLEENRLSELPGVDIAVAPYLERAYRHDEENWAVFSMRRLAESPLFMQVAV